MGLIALVLQDIHEKLGIPNVYADDTDLPIYSEPDDLVSIGEDIFARPQQLTREAATKWCAMKLAASEDCINLRVVSAFRSVDYQASLINSKLEKGQLIEEILKVNAAPGYSEHHSGRALDLTTHGSEPLSEVFDKTDAFHWLVENARKYEFRLSYPRNNKWGMAYEPWHWCYIAGLNLIPLR